MKSNSFKGMLSDFQNGTYDFTCDGKCIGCGECCSNILPLATKEIKEIKRYVTKHKIKQIKHGATVCKEQLDLVCPFLDNSKDKDKCLIYPVRPMVCRMFICDPKQRKDVPEKFLGKFTPCIMSEVFFGGTEVSDLIRKMLEKE